MRSAWWLAGLLAVCWASTTKAQDSARVQQAIQLFDAARQSLKRGDVASACESFVQSERLDPQLGTKLHLADCYERLGKLASAWVQFRAAEILAAERNARGVAEPRGKIAHVRAARLQSRLPTLRFSLRSKTPQPTVALDERELTPRTWGTAVPVNPGPHTLTVTAQGRIPWHHELDIAEQEHIELVVPELAPEPARTTSRAAAPRTRAHSSRALEPQAVVAYAAGGVGLLALGAGVVLGIVTESTVSERDKLCPNDLCRDQREMLEVGALTRRAQRTASVANVLMIGGGVALAAGVTLFVLGTKSDEPKVSVALSVTPVSAGLTLHARGF